MMRDSLIDIVQLATSTIRDKVTRNNEDSQTVRVVTVTTSI